MSTDLAKLCRDICLAPYQTTRLSLKLVQEDLRCTETVDSAWPAGGFDCGREGQPCVYCGHAVCVQCTEPCECGFPLHAQCLDDHLTESGHTNVPPKKPAVGEYNA